MMPTIPATAVQIQRLINDICRNDFSSHSTLMMHADETHHVGANWTVVDEIAVKRITGATSIEKVLQELLAEGGTLGISRIRYHWCKSFDDHMELISVDAVGQSKATTDMLKQGKLREYLSFGSLSRSHAFWCLFCNQPIVFCGTPESNVVATSDFSMTCPVVTLTDDRCRKVIGEKSDWWLEVPLIIAGRPYGKLSCDLRGEPTDSSMIPQIIRFWMLARLVAPLLELLRQSQHPEQGPEPIDDWKMHTGETDVSLTDVFRKLMVLEKVTDAAERIWIYSKEMQDDGTIVFTHVNKAFADHVGVEPSMMIGKTDSEFNPNADEVAKYERADRKILMGGPPLHIDHESWTSADGEIREFRTVKEGVNIGGSIQLIGVATDITEERLLETALHNVLNTIDCRISFTSPVDGRILICNRPFAIGAGYRMTSQAIGQTPYDYLKAKSAAAVHNVSKRVAASLTQDGPRDHDLAFKDGTSTKLRSLSVPILSKGDANKAVAVLHVATEHDDPMWQESLVGAKECVEGVLNSGNDDWFRT